MRAGGLTSRKAATHVHGWRRWLVGGYIVVGAVLVAVWVFSIVVPIRNLIEQRVRDGLVSVANAAAVAVQSSERPAGEVLRLIATSDDLRLTLIAADGTVLAESATTDGSMQNHADRPEVAAALAGQTGFDRRVSETDGVEYFYVTVPCSLDDGPAVVRVSQPMSQVKRLITTYLWTSLGLLAAALVVAVAAASIASKRAGAPVRRLESMRTDFVANASHELKTPVAGIRLLSDSIAQAATNGDEAMVVALTERLGDESARLQRLVGDLMDLSRIEDTGRTSTAGSSCELGAVVATSVEAHRARAEKAGLELRLRDQMPAGTRVGVSATDATLICDNLISNAITYTEQGSVEVVLQAAGDDASAAGEALLTVRDTGIGIAFAEQERVFERFYRVDTARSRERGGTGLGLSLVRHAAERAGGGVELASTPGEGSSFCVRLPLA